MSAIRYNQQTDSTTIITRQLEYLGRVQFSQKLNGLGQFDFNVAKLTEVDGVRSREASSRVLEKTLNATTATESFSLVDDSGTPTGQTMTWKELADALDSAFLHLVTIADAP